MNLFDSPAWRALAAHAEAIRPQHLRDLFAENPARFADFSIRHDGLLLDFSKQRINAETLHLLHAYADKMPTLMAGNRKCWQAKQSTIPSIAPSATWPCALAQQAPNEVKAVLERMQRFCESVHSGSRRGFSGERITDVVNIGIGGSDLGPRMAVHALAARQQPDIDVHFIANVDGADIAPLLARLNPRTTLFIVASKTFTTLETLTNARTARAWLLATAGNDSAIASHFVGDLDQS
jgi:glucose-6-phosphate isomerase